MNTAEDRDVSFFNIFIHLFFLFLMAFSQDGTSVYEDFFFFNFGASPIEWISYKV